MNRKNGQKDSSRDTSDNLKKTSSNKVIPVKNSLFGVGITNDTSHNILEYLVHFVENTNENCYIVTPNPEIILFATKHSDFKNTLNHARIALCDGVGLLLAGKMLGKPFKERITGVDFMEKLCKQVAGKPITVGFLGGRNGVAKSASECLLKKYPRLQVKFIGEDWKQNQAVDILFVAFGFPKQEQWMYYHLNKIPVRVMMGVGGSFDYMSGKIPRAPDFLRVIGLEWLYRLVRQPWRWKRQLALVEFLELVVKEKFGIRC
jgi:N-acetylglucosaminyldiphosphoundecaprenol N-acetyl-beta-D-mannosaminyltransferase